MNRRILTELSNYVTLAQHQYNDQQIDNSTQTCRRGRKFAEQIFFDDVATVSEKIYALYFLIVFNQRLTENSLVENSTKQCVNLYERVLFAIWRDMNELLGENPEVSENDWILINADVNNSLIVILKFHKLLGDYLDTADNQEFKCQLYQNLRDTLLKYDNRRVVKAEHEYLHSYALLLLDYANTLHNVGKDEQARNVVSNAIDMALFDLKLTNICRQQAESRFLLVKSYELLAQVNLQLNNIKQQYLALKKCIEQGIQASIHDVNEEEKSIIYEYLGLAYLSLANFFGKNKKDDYCQNSALSLRYYELAIELRAKLNIDVLCNYNLLFSICTDLGLHAHSNNNKKDRSRYYTKAKKYYELLQKHRLNDDVSEDEIEQYNHLKKYVDIAELFDEPSRMSARSKRKFPFATKNNMYQPPPKKSHLKKNSTEKVSSHVSSPSKTVPESSPSRIGGNRK